MASPRHLPPLDGIRGLAILIVLTLHYGGGAQSSNVLVRAMGMIIRGGWSGVSLFFVLSGFLISGILWDVRDTANWRRTFYIRRSLRIFALYYGALLLTVIAGFMAGTGLYCLSKIWVFAIFLQDFPWLGSKISDIGSPLWLTHFWSLAVEEQFYIIWPFLLIRMKTLREARYLCLAVFCSSEIFRMLVWHFGTNPERYSPFILTRVGELAMGAFLAMCYRDDSWDRVRAWAPALTPIAFGICIAAGLANHTFWLTGRIGFLIFLPSITIAYGGLLVLSLSSGVFSWLATMTWLRRLGGISYGIYVFHVLFIGLWVRFASRMTAYFAPHAGRNAGLIANAFVGIVGSIVIAWLSYHYYELPFLRLRRRYELSRLPEEFPSVVSGTNLSLPTELAS